MSEQIDFGSFVGEKQASGTKKEFKPRTKSYPLDEVVSALQKCIRRGEEALAMYFAVEMIEAGYMDYCWRRLIIIASEDIGIADPFASVLVGRMYENAQISLGKAKKAELNDQLEPLAQAVLYMCRTQKSRYCDDFLNYVMQQREAGWKPEIPDWAIDMHTERGRKLGRGGVYFCQTGWIVKPEVKIEGPDYWVLSCAGCKERARCSVKDQVAKRNG